MTDRGSAVLLRLIVLLGILFLGYVLLRGPFRAAETAAATWLASGLGRGAMHVAPGSSVIVYPFQGQPFRAIVTTSCSSLAAVLAIGCLASLAPAYAQRRKVMAASAAMAAVVLGNIVRIAGSLDIGLIAGRSSLVLFHDSIGNVFSFAYTLGGYILMLWLLLPSDCDSPMRLSSGRP